MSTTYELVEGWTGVIDVNLLAQGAVPTGTMVGFTVALVLKDLDGNTIDTTGDVSIVDETNWQVRYTPDAADLTVGRYRGRFKVIDGSGAIAYFPSGEWDIWVIRSVA